MQGESAMSNKLTTDGAHLRMDERKVFDRRDLLTVISSRALWTLMPTQERSVARESMVVWRRYKD